MNDFLCKGTNSVLHAKICVEIKKIHLKMLCFVENISV